jgi:hypothetical protein
MFILLVGSMLVGKLITDRYQIVGDRQSVEGGV